MVKANILYPPFFGESWAR